MLIKIKLRAFVDGKESNLKVGPSKLAIIPNYNKTYSKE